MEVMQVGCWAFEVGHLISVSQVMRRHVRFCKKKSYDAAGIEEGFSGSFQGTGQRGNAPVEGSSEEKLLLASEVELVGLVLGEKGVGSEVL